MHEAIVQVREGSRGCAPNGKGLILAVVVDTTRMDTDVIVVEVTPVTVRIGVYLDGHRILKRGSHRRRGKQAVSKRRSVGSNASDSNSTGSPRGAFVLDDKGHAVSAASARNLELKCATETTGHIDGRVVPDSATIRACGPKHVVHA